MSQIETHGILIQLSNEWYVFEDNGKLVGHGPDNTEVIATSIVLTGKGTESERKDSLEMSKMRIAQLMRRNASNSKLVVTTEMFEKMLPSGIKLTQLSSVATDGAIAFDQFMLVVGEEVLFLTYEGPISAGKNRDLVHAAIEFAKLR
jgi:hypothetical protein